MRSLTWVAVLALAATTAVAPMARAQDEPRDEDGSGDPAAIEQAEMGPGMEAGMDGLGLEAPGLARRRGPGGLRGMRGGRDFRGRGFGPPLEALRELDLTDSQHERLVEIREQRLKAAIPIEADLRLAELELGKLARAERPDAQAVDRQIDRISALRASLMKNRVAGMFAARAVLTPAQQKKLRDRRREGPPRASSPRGVRSRADAPREEVDRSR